MDMNDFINMLNAVYKSDTAHPSYVKKWSVNNPTAGHCAVAALLIQEKFGGQVAKVKVGRSTHYFNIIDGKIIDATREQFSCDVSYNDYIVCDASKMLKNKDFANRYKLFKSRVQT